MSFNIIPKILSTFRRQNFLVRCHQDRKCSLTPLRRCAPALLCTAYARPQGASQVGRGARPGGARQGWDYLDREINISTCCCRHRRRGCRRPGHRPWAWICLCAGRYRHRHLHQPDQGGPEQARFAARRCRRWTDGTGDL